MKYLIIGLGNIGAEYVDTRHNIGFMVADALAEKLDATFSSDRYANSAEGRFKGKQLHLIKPTTYMNLSGKAVRYHLKQNGLEPAQLVVITDDLALPFGKCRLRLRGSDGGHNGLKHINEVLNTREYPRMRVGIGDNYPKGAQVRYVLNQFSEKEQPFLPEIIDHCVQGVLNFVTIGPARTMSTFNGWRIDQD
ncbi:MAG: aminoacyl-tRNA hydrolase [Bacteroidota bacterium]